LHTNERSNQSFSCFKKCLSHSLYVATPSLGKITLFPLCSRGTSSFSILQVKGGKLLFLPYLIIVLSLLLPDLGYLLIRHSGYLLIRDSGDLLTGKWFFCSSRIGGVCSHWNGGILLISYLGHFPTSKTWGGGRGTWSPPRPDWGLILCAPTLGVFFLYFLIWLSWHVWGLVWYLNVQLMLHRILYSIENSMEGSVSFLKWVCPFAIPLLSML
jgi:hypothetical protein